MAGAGPAGGCMCTISSWQQRNGCALWPGGLQAVCCPRPCWLPPSVASPWPPPRRTPSRPHARAPNPPHQTSDSLRNAGPDPKRFTVPDGQLANVAGAAFAALARLGSGGFASGYSSGLREDDGKYGVLKFSGRAVGEPTLCWGGL
jgi:hypothetical protein